MSLPAVFNPNRPSPDGSEPVRSGPSEIAANMQALADIWGIPTSPTQITAAVAAISSSGVLSITQAGATVAADPTTGLGIATKQYVDSTATGFAIITGPNDYTGNLAPTPASLGALQARTILVQPGASNTGAVTINLNSFGAVPVVDWTGAPLQAGTLFAGITYSLVYNGSKFVLQGFGPQSYFGVAAGANSYAATLVPTPASQDALKFRPLVIQFQDGNSGACTLNLNGFGGRPILDRRLQVLQTSRFVPFTSYTLTWDGGNYILQESPPQFQTFANGGALSFNPGVIQWFFIGGGTSPQTASWPVAYTQVFGALAGVVNASVATTATVQVISFDNTQVTIQHNSSGTVNHAVIGIGI